MKTVFDFAKTNRIGEERVRQMCKQGMIPGAIKIGEGVRGVWMIPDNATMPKMARGRPRVVDATKYPQLLAVMWDRKDKVVHENEALALYERNRKWIDVAAMEQNERMLLDGLIRKYGNGVFNG